jgi:hypothetical protein
LLFLIRLAVFISVARELWESCIKGEIVEKKDIQFVDIQIEFGGFWLLELPILSKIRCFSISIYLPFLNSLSISIDRSFRLLHGGDALITTCCDER